MKIQESCEDWTLAFNSPNQTELTEEEQEHLKHILHTTGDSLGIILNIPEEESELRNRIIEVITSIYLDARARMQVAVEFTIMNQAILSPLQRGFTDEDLFGENLTDALKSTLTEKELEIADEFLNPKDPTEEDNEEKEDED